MIHGFTAMLFTSNGSRTCALLAIVGQVDLRLALLLRDFVIRHRIAIGAEALSFQ